MKANDYKPALKAKFPEVKKLSVRRVKGCWKVGIGKNDFEAMSKETYDSFLGHCCDIENNPENYASITGLSSGAECDCEAQGFVCLCRMRKD